MNLTNEGGEVGFQSLRAYLFSDQSARTTEKIEVNQRHLIDKILARYSAEYTIFREVLQNANDAGASTVEFRFLGKPNESGKDVTTITSMVLCNNGRPFNDADWARLKKIAEGNPDEEKIGFFGVGFYSLFSISDEPLVVSKDRCLAFYWYGDQLYARPGTTPVEMMDKASRWTLIFLSLRESMKLPALDPFAHFISKALLFTESIEQIKVFLNDELLFGVNKKRSIESTLPVSFNHLLNRLTTKPHGIFTLKEVHSQAVQLDLDKRYQSDLIDHNRDKEKSLLSSLWSAAKSLAKDRQTKLDEEQMKSPGIFSLFLHTITVEAKAATSSSFAQAMERVTKKKPPSRVRLQVLYSSFDEILASFKTSSRIPHPVLEGVLPCSRIGKIFIGFETHQTTGMSIHVTGPFIPTVERESLDFIDKNLAAWNEELVRLIGKVVRVIYQIEVEQLAKLFPEGEKEKSPDDYLERCNHIFQAFYCRGSTPATIVSLLLEEEFYQSTKPAHFLIPSKIGVVPVERLRLIPEEVRNFVHSLPTFHTYDEKGFSGQVKDHFNIPIANFYDILNSLNRLCEKDLIAALSWIVLFVKRHNLDYKAYYKCLSNIIVPGGRKNDEIVQWISLDNVKYFVTDLLVAASYLPLPINCLSPQISDKFYGFDLASSFQIAELTIPEWLYWYVSKSQLDDVDAERLLIFLAKYFKICSDENKARLVSIISQKCLIKTTKGLQRPADCYLESVKALADEAPVVDFLNRRALPDEFLIALGVQSHIDVQHIFQNLNQMKWDHHQLVKYMAEHKEALSSDELVMLQNARIFPAIGIADKRFTLSELYLDDEIIRLLKLPVLNWKDGQAPSPSSRSTIFMVSLGLHTIAPWPLLLQNVSSASSRQRTDIFRYFLRHLQAEYKGMFHPREINFEFLPLKNNQERLGHPLNCFTDGPLQLLSFDILDDELVPFAEQLGVLRRPKASLIVENLVEQRFNKASMPGILAYLSTILGEFSRHDLYTLSQASFLPYENVFLRPIDMYFGKGPFDVGFKFPVADYGEHAKPFLQACGVQIEPKATKIVELMAIEAPSILKNIGVEEYLNLLRWISVQYGQLDRSALEALKNKAVLLGLDYAMEEVDKDKEVEGNHDTPIRSRYILAHLRDIFIIDDTVAQQAFHCLSVPLDATMEAFYKKLGVQYLTQVVKSKWKVIGSQKSTLASKALEDLVHSRSLLLVSGPVSAQSKSDGLTKLRKLRVFSIDKILIKREFWGQIHEFPTTACFSSDKQLLVMENFDYFDVATMLCQLLFTENRLQDALLLSTLLSSSLASLRAKGFPVDRLLLGTAPGKSALGLNADKNPAIPNEKSTQTSEQIAIENRPSPSTEDVNAKACLALSEEHSKEHLPQAGSVLRNTEMGQLIKSMTTKLGGFTERFKGLKGMTQGNDLITESPSSLPSTNTTTNPLPNRVDNFQLSQLLTNGIKSLRDSHDTEMVSDAGGIIRPPLDIRNEASRYCEVVPSHQLRRVGLFDGRIPVFASLNDPNMAPDLSNLNEFGCLLCRLATIFGIEASTLSIYIDRQSTSIAFNRDRSLFFNFSHFERQVMGGLGLENIGASWFMTFCHELAHNFVRFHNEEHEFYMSAYAEMFIPLYYYE